MGQGRWTEPIFQTDADRILGREKRGGEGHENHEDNDDEASHSGRILPEKPEGEEELLDPPLMFFSKLVPHG